MYNYQIKYFNTDDNSGFKNSSVTKKNGRPYTISFSAPPNFLKDAPWSRHCPRLIQILEEQRYDQKEIEKFESDELSFDDAVKWLEKQNQNIQWQDYKAIYT